MRARSPCLALAFIAALFYSCASGAVEIVGGVGVSYAQTVECGFWYDCDAKPRSLHLKTPAFRIGVSVPLGERWRVAASYVNNGVQSSDAIAAVADKNYRFVGEGSANGVSIAGERSLGRVVLGAGPYVFVPRWSEDTYGYGMHGRFVSSGATHLGATVSATLPMKHGEVRVDYYGVCLMDRCASAWPRSVPGIWRSLTTVTYNVRFKL